MYPHNMVIPENATYYLTSWSAEPVMPQPDLVRLAKKNISNVQKNAIPNGIITLKGGDLTHEIMPLKDRSEIININNYFDEPFFDSKKIVYTIV